MAKKYPKRKFAVIDNTSKLDDSIKFALLKQALSATKNDSKYYKQLRLKQKMEKESMIYNKLKSQ